MNIQNKLKALAGSILWIFVTFSGLATASESDQMLLLTQLPLSKVKDGEKWRKSAGDGGVKSVNLYEFPGDKAPLSFYCVPSSEWKANIKPTEIASKVGPIESCTAPRFITSVKDTIRIGYLEVVKSVGENCPTSPQIKLSEIEIDEQPRDTVFRSQLKDVLKKIVEVGGAAPEPGEKLLKLCFYELGEILLKSDRAIVAVKTSVVDNDKVTASTSLITGPTEHWFLSGDAIVKGAKELKYDSATNSITERNKPSQVYLGFNFMIGDVYAKAPKISTEWVVFKLFISPSSSPFDSVGVGIGYRFADGIFDTSKSSSHSGFVIFVGSFWTKGDKLNGQTLDANSGYSQSTRFGISYSIGTALGWLK